MQEMGVNGRMLRVELGAEHQRLAEAAHPVRRRVATNIAKPYPKSRLIPSTLARGAPAAPDPKRLAIEVFGQVRDRGGDVGVDGMDVGIRGVAKRIQMQLDPAALEGENFLGDERFGEAGIAFENEGDGADHVIRFG